MHALLVLPEGEFASIDAALSDAQGDWTWVHASSLDVARSELLGEAAFDVVVCDVGLVGPEWLGEVAERAPISARLALIDGSSGGAERIVASAAHQCLPKPLDGALLGSAMSRTHHWRTLAGDARVVAQLTRLRTVPTLARTHGELIDAMREEEPNLTLIAEIIADDPPMSAKVLQLINSPYFGVREVISNIKQAVTLLGLDLLDELVFSHAVFQAFSGQVDEALLEQLWREGHAVASLVDRLGRHLALDDAVRGELRLAAFVHDIGRLALLALNGPAYGPCAALEGEALIAKEHELFAIDHATAGAYLLNLWGLPESIVQAVHHHHRPPEDPPGWKPGWLVGLAVQLVGAPVEDWPQDLAARWAALTDAEPAVFETACRDAASLVHGH